MLGIVEEIKYIKMQLYYEARKPINQSALANISCMNKLSEPLSCISLM